jgi:hypothetical protein
MRTQVDNPHVSETVPLPPKYEHRAVPPGELSADQMHEMPDHRGGIIELGRD